jgi:hypothetical protein
MNVRIQYGATGSRELTWSTMYGLDELAILQDQHDAEDIHDCDYNYNYNDDVDNVQIPTVQGGDIKTRHTGSFTGGSGSGSLGGGRGRRENNKNEVLINIDEDVTYLGSYIHSKI